MRALPLALLLALGGCGVPMPIVVAGLGLASGVIKLDTALVQGWLGRGPVMPADLPPVLVLIP